MQHGEVLAQCGLIPEQPRLSHTFLDPSVEKRFPKHEAERKIIGNRVDEGLETAPRNTLCSRPKTLLYLQNQFGIQVAGHHRPTQGLACSTRGRDHLHDVVLKYKLHFRSERSCPRRGIESRNVCGAAMGKYAR